MPTDPPGPRPIEWDAAAYHRLSQPQITWGQKVLTRLALRGDEMVMDAGCGTGRLTAELLARLPHGHVIAVDQSEQMLEAAREYLTPHFGNRVSFVRADLADLQLVEPVDVIFSAATLHWVLDHLRLFRSLYRTLKPGGWLVAQCGGGPNLAHLLRRAADLMASDLYAPFFSGWPVPWEFADAATAAERLRVAGFAEIATSLEPAPTVLGGDEGYREFLACVIFREHLARVTDETLRARFIAALSEAATQDHPPYALDYWRLNLRARRPILTQAARDV